MGNRICISCGQNKKHNANGLCNTCYAREKRKDPIFKAKELANQRRWRHTNSDKVKAYKAKRRHTDRLKVYNLNPEVYAKLEPLGCSICGRTDKLYIDHNHENGKFRGLLCPGCNTALGLFKDDIMRLATAIQYLKDRRD